jgi:HEPN domain-containing protein
MPDSRNSRDWFLYAEDDFQYALEGLEAHPRGACQLLAQACEKYLKASILHSGVPAPRTHDLVALLELLPTPPPTPSLERSAAELIAQAVVPNRYPGNQPEPTLEEAKAILRAAEMLRNFSRQLLGLVE